MTACVNKKSKRVAAVVTASLVGALSIGAPAVALAANGIDMLATNENAIAGGTINFASGASGDTFVYNGLEQGLVATTLTPQGGADAEALQLYTQKVQDADKSGFYYFYVDLSGSNAMSGDLANIKYTDANGKEQTVEGSILNAKPSKIGKYAVVAGYMTAGEGWDMCKTAGVFQIAGQSLSSAKLVDDGDVDDTSFDNTGVTDSLKVSGMKSRIDVAVDGVVVDESLYSLEFYVPGNTDPIADTTNLECDKSYTVKVTGKGAYDGQTVEIKNFTVGKLNLDTAALSGVVTDSEAPSNASKLADVLESINGNKLDKLGTTICKNDIELSFVSAPQESTLPGGKGEYTFKLTAKKDSKYVEGSKEFTVVYADHVASFKYGDDRINDSYTVDLSEDEPTYFDVTKITATYDSNVKVDTKDIKVTATDEDGNAATIDSLKTPGTWVVTASVNFTKQGELVAGSVSTKVSVSYGTVAQNANVFFTYDGKNIEGDTIPDIYIGEDLSKKLGIKVIKGDKTFVEGTDYTVTVTTKTDDGKTVVVDNITDAGDYTVTVKGITFKIDGNSTTAITFKVEKAKVNVVLKNTVTDRTTTGKNDTDDGTFLPYTGSSIDPEFSFVYREGDKKDETVDIDASTYSVLYTKYGSQSKVDVKNVGQYAAKFNDSNVKNFDIVDKSFWVKKAASFTDVKDSDWFVGAVYQAKENGYVNGVKGTKLFNPNADITRADAVCILYNMAGGKKVEDMDKAEKLAWTSKVTFSDVDVDQYFGVAMGWADSLDIANGSNGVFRPYDIITREEFAALLSNYAKATGDYEAVDADEVLGSAADYTAWAKDVVAWAKANGIMGNNGAAINGTGVITRAEVAAMAVNYQAEPLK